MTSFSEIIRYLNVINNRCKIPGPHTQLSTYGGIGPSVSPNYLPQPTHSWHFLWPSHFFSLSTAMPVTETSNLSNTKQPCSKHTDLRIWDHWGKALRPVGLNLLNAAPSPGRQPQLFAWGLPTVFVSFRLRAVGYPRDTPYCWLQSRSKRDKAIMVVI